MLIAASILAFLNLSGMLVLFVTLMLSFAPDTPGFFAIMWPLAGMLLFFIQRASIRRFIELNLSNEVDGEDDDEDDQTIPLIDLWRSIEGTYWLRTALVIGNILLAGLILPCLWQLVRHPAADSPMFYFRYGFHLFLTAVAAANVCYSVVLTIEDIWPKGYARAALVTGAGVLAVFLSSQLVYLPDWLAEQRAGYDWPNFEEITLRDGTSVKVAPPPGYIRVDLSGSEVEKYINYRCSSFGDKGNTALAVFVSSQRDYESLEKHMAGSKECGYEREAGLAWLYQSRADRRKSAEAAPPQAGLPAWISPKRENESNYITGPAYAAACVSHANNDYTGRFLCTDYEVQGSVVLDGQLITVISHYYTNGGFKESRRKKHLEQNKQWLEAVAGANPGRGGAQ